MNRAVSLWLVVALAGRPISAGAATSTTTVDPATCLSAISMAEREIGLPPQLLRAIALVESGRVDPATGKIVPWAWSLNAQGTGQMFETKAAAIAALEGELARGTVSVDVGCMQVNLAHHPHAFASLDEAFEPQANVRYAARFLLSLYRRSGDWAVAAMAYHSQTPDIGAGYIRRVTASWPAGAVLLRADSAGARAKKATISENYTPQFASWVRQNSADAARLLARHSRIELGSQLIKILGRRGAG